MADIMDSMSNPAFVPTTANNDADSPQFVHRVAHLPLVALSLAKVMEIYQRTKLRNELLGYALEKGEQTVLTSLDVVSGIATRTGLQGPLNMADHSACYMLSKVEEKLPIIKYTPDEIKTSTWRIYDDNVRPRIDQLNHLKESTVQKYNDVFNYGSNKLFEAKNFGAAKVKTVLDVPSQTVEWSLNAADCLVDKLLPEEEIQPLAEEIRINGHTGNLDHAKFLSSKLRQRVAIRIAHNVQAAELLAQAFQIVDRVKKTSAAASVHHIWEDIRRLSGSMDIGEVSLTNVEQRSLALVQRLTTQLKDTLEANTLQLTGYLPEHIKQRLQYATDVARDIFHQVSQARSLDDLSHTLIGQVNGHVNTVQSTMNSLLDLMTETYLLKWLIPEYNNIGSLDIHMHG